MHFSPGEFFHMHTVLISMSTKQAFPPALPSRILDVLWRWPWKDQRNGMKRNRIPVLFRFFGWWELLPWQKELCWVTAAPLCSPPLHLQMGKGRAEGAMGEQQLCLAHKPLINGDAKNHTQQQCRITQTIWENRWFKAIHAPFQRDMQNVAELSFWKHFWQVYFLLIWREGFPSDCFKCKYYSHKTHQPICKLWPLVKLAIFLCPLSTRYNS